MNMRTDIGKIASLIGDEVRANILWTLIDGRAFTATEIATRVDVSMPNLSAHLKRLSEAGLIEVRKQGRHRYFQITRNEVAELVEMMAAISPMQTVSADGINPLAFCRSCYDHLAGRVGVAIKDRMVSLGIISLDNGRYRCMPQGKEFFAELGIDSDTLQSGRRTFAKPCLDWTERLDHMSGSLAAAFLTTTLRMGWFKRNGDTRALTVTTLGRREIFQRLGVIDGLQ